MIPIKSPANIGKMKAAGRIAANALETAGRAIKSGMTTKELDKVMHDYIISCGAKPSFLGYNGFKGSACISINEEVIHGIPSDRVIMEGDLVSVDVGACFDGFHGDCAKTFFVGDVPERAKKLAQVTEQSFFEGIKMALAGNRIGDISNAVQSYCESFGYGVVYTFNGHGIGRALHEDPTVPNKGLAKRGVKLIPGMTLAIEPMVNEGTAEVRILSDEWTVVTKDGKLSAHYENTILITDRDPVILTAADI